MKTFCSLSPLQITLYQKALESMTLEIKKTEGIQRKGIILSYLMNFKQICNHPCHFMKEGSFLPEDSGKFLRLREICETIREKQEKVLIFTQFQSMTDPLCKYLETIFGRPGLILHGGTPVKKKK